ncbi:MAG TPA: DUF2085 domain-containing protein [Ktedonobacterales bacterium]|nr:DUF2085 domain-containing protein [Ktedonobacterales bacterium]
MSIEQANPPAPVSTTPAPPAPARQPSPPDWLVIGLGAVYVVAIAALAFLPGATLIERLRTLDGGICAQIPSHSFFPGGQQLPLCSRNTGIYSGFTAATLVLWATGRIRSAQLPSKWVSLVFGLCVLILAIDGFNSLFLDLGLPHLYQPHNLLRLATGLGTGTAMAAFIIPVANTLVWKHEDQRPSFASVRQLSLMLPVLLLAFLAIGTIGSSVAFMLYPIALFSSAGLILALTLVNIVLFLGVGNHVGRFATWHRFFPIFTLAVVCAIIELLALFALKSSMMAALMPGTPGM